jgi:hypothetical protein
MKKAFCDLSSFRFLSHTGSGIWKSNNNLTGAIKWNKPWKTGCDISTEDDNLFFEIHGIRYLGKASQGFCVTVIKNYFGHLLPIVENLKKKKHKIHMYDAGKNSIAML